MPTALPALVPPPPIDCSLLLEKEGALRLGRTEGALLVCGRDICGRDCCARCMEEDPRRLELKALER